MKRGYQDDCDCIHCAGIRRDREQDLQEVRRRLGEFLDESIMGQEDSEKSPNVGISGMAK